MRDTTRRELSTFAMKHSKPKILGSKRLAFALHLRELGLNLLPLRDKVPQRKWKRLQTTRNTMTELVEWFFSRSYEIGIITGELSGIVVVDCDAPEMAEKCSRSDVTQRTKRGLHLIYAHPGRTTKNRHKVGGLPIDVRGDGGYVCAYPDAAAWSLSGILTAPDYVEPACHSL
jgi:hypothetical protein